MQTEALSWREIPILRRMEKYLSAPQGQRGLGLAQAAVFCCVFSRQGLALLNGKVQLRRQPTPFRNALYPPPVASWRHVNVVGHCCRSFTPAIRDRRSRQAFQHFSHRPVRFRREQVRGFTVRTVARKWKCKGVRFPHSGNEDALSKLGNAVIGGI